MYLSPQRANKYLTIYLDEKALIIPSICLFLWYKYPTSFKLLNKKLWRDANNSLSGLGIS